MIETFRQTENCFENSTVFKNIYTITSESTVIFTKYNTKHLCSVLFMELLEYIIIIFLRCE